MSNLSSQHEILHLKSSKISIKGSLLGKAGENKEHQANDSKNCTQDNTESFLNSLLRSLEQTNEFLPDRMKIDQKEIVNEAMSRLEKGVFDESDKISIFQSAPLMQILSLLDKLKAPTKDIKLGNLSNQFPEFVKTEANFDALKGASNLNELLDIAKDLGLNVKDIKIDRLLDLKSTFPNLDKADFFKGSIDSIFKQLINDKIADLSKKLNQQLQDSSHLLKQKSYSQPKDFSPSLLSQTLKNLDSMLLSKENKNEKIDKVKVQNAIEIKKDKKSLNESIKIDDKKSNHASKDSKTRHLITENVQQEKLLTKSVKEDISSQDLPNFKVLNKEDKENKNFIKETNKVQENKLNQDPVKEQNKNLKDYKQDVNLNIKSNKEILKDSQNSNLTQKDFTLIKDIKTNAKEMKDTKSSSLEQKINVENLNQVQGENYNKTQMMQKEIDNDSSKETVIKEQVKTPSQNTHENNLDDLNSLVKDLNKVTQNSTRNLSPKETLQYFSQDLKEALDDYKTPITKLNIKLNPNNLGEVEVTLIQRGNNLHINFNSNTNAMNLFMQHQVEFKNSLVNMGFTGLEMNFSDQGKKEQNQNQGKNRSSTGFKDILEGKSEGEKINLELVLAKYF
ncbi:flagellar hook-length control protein FliK [Campylobacter sp. VicNov18]|uniref:flagellar hook-length control protein FliK n=1 Tax=Campylobacter bilis TaxID=2691918 RepID=UPI00130E2C2D|nr:flagellar hook-length control protein FliK [Campylobacter bilis]MPV63082.1 flagellar hook-length control protein FliK [Campylobacter hepaticus]MBM0636581.1 flagellar hook-length control protein FliK [Campylobacter bilis]MCC8277289.1 flagellar hook-length control protein FliK [Campylobacter bilis]MCC8299032.1 flagellar hook-length control protein FliK [Campylobacter bilis]MCC8300198.1 flagellar hook-length control protein FliK [Campylobacter bilis]